MEFIQNSNISAFTTSPLLISFLSYIWIKSKDVISNKSLLRYDIYKIFLEELEKVPKEPIDIIKTLDLGRLAFDLQTNKMRYFEKDFIKKYKKGFIELTFIFNYYIFRKFSR